MYTPAVAAFLDTLRLAAAVATALGHNRLHAIVRGLYIPADDDPYCDLANPKRMSWRDQPEAAALYDQLVALRLEIAKHLDVFTDPDTRHDAA